MPSGQINLVISQTPNFMYHIKMVLPVSIIHMFLLPVVLYMCSLRLYCMYYVTIGGVNYASELKLEQMKARLPAAYSLHQPSLITPTSPWRRDGLEARDVDKRRQLEQLKILKKYKIKQNVS